MGSPCVWSTKHAPSQSLDRATKTFVSKEGLEQATWPSILGIKNNNNNMLKRRHMTQLKTHLRWTRTMLVGLDFQFVHFCFSQIVDIDSKQLFTFSNLIIYAFNHQISELERATFIRSPPRLSTGSRTRQVKRPHSHLFTRDLHHSSQLSLSLWTHYI